jgi:hypothetical protein
MKWHDIVFLLLCAAAITLYLWLPPEFKIVNLVYQGF